MHESSHVCWQQYGAAAQTAAVHEVGSGGASQPGANGWPLSHIEWAHCPVLESQLRLRQTVRT